MMRTVSVLLSLGVLLAGAAVGRADDQAMAVIDKAIQAHGGAATLSKFKAETWKTKGTMAAGTLKYTAEYAFLAPDHFRFTLDADLGGKQVQLLAFTDGKEGWERSASQRAEMTKEKFGEFKHQVYTMWVSSLMPLKAKEFTLTLAPERKLGNQGDQVVVGVKVASPGRRDVVLFFDKSTGLLAGNESKVLDEFSGFTKEVTQEVLVGNYKELNGRKYFTQMVIKRDGKALIEEELFDQKSLEKLDESLFKLAKTR